MLKEDTVAMQLRPSGIRIPKKVEAEVFMRNSVDVNLSAKINDFLGVASSGGIAVKYPLLSFTGGTSFSFVDDRSDKSPEDQKLVDENNIKLSSADDGDFLDQDFILKQFIRKGSFTSYNGSASEFKLLFNANVNININAGQLPSDTFTEGFNKVFSVVGSLTSKIQLKMRIHLGDISINNLGELASFKPGLDSLKRGIQGRYGTAFGFKDGSFLDVTAEIDLNAPAPVDEKSNLELFGEFLKSLALTLGSTLTVPTQLAVIGQFVNDSSLKLFEDAGNKWNVLLERLEITELEFKGRTTQELDVGTAASFVVGAEFDLELGRTYTIDRPFFKRKGEFNNYFNNYDLSLADAKNLNEVVLKLVNPAPLVTTKPLGKRLFKTFFFQ